MRISMTLELDNGDEITTEAMPVGPLRPGGDCNRDLDGHHGQTHGDAAVRLGGTDLGRGHEPRCAGMDSPSSGGDGRSSRDGPRTELSTWLGMARLGWAWRGMAWTRQGREI